jgi:uncharacterized protein YndB with AHSA1/START domain
MTKRNAAFDMFTLERTYDHPVEKVFAAFADEKAKDKWFARAHDELTLIERAFDFRPGGKERATGRWKSGMVSRFDAVYFEIVPNERIIYSYEMHLDDVRISVSLATLQFKANGKSTALSVTEQGVFVDGYEDKGSREHGTAALLDMMGKSLEG